MGQRAEASGLRLTSRDAASVKAMLDRGDRQHDIAAWFGVNSGRIAEVAVGFRSPTSTKCKHTTTRPLSKWKGYNACAGSFGCS
jgi:hypothetical protein